ncbi:MAG: metal-dependent hydrolase [Acidimicrobiia bacterium]|nr:metal-dependent hydrolase [Acidimicrobiia bacterium]
MSVVETQRTERPSAHREIPVRKLGTVPDVTGEEWIVEGDPIFSHLLATLSAVFPRGEEFFVTSVRRHRDAVADQPELKAQVKGFIGQEAMHGREHRHLNARLAELGYNTVRADKTIGRICSAVLRMRPRRLAIAATAAAEHYTGLLGETALVHEPTRRILFGQEAVEPLICWHALEELEHKNVAYDVMVASGGGYGVRVAGFAVTTTALAGYIVFEWGRSVVEDRDQITPQHAQKFLQNLVQQRLISFQFLFNALKYLRPGFHPDDTNTDELVEQWRIVLADVATAQKTSENRVKVERIALDDTASKPRKAGAKNESAKR